MNKSFDIILLSAFFILIAVMTSCNNSNQSFIDLNAPQLKLINSILEIDNSNLIFNDVQIQISNKNVDSPGFEYLLTAIAKNRSDQPQQFGFEIHTKSKGWLSGSYGIAKSFIIPASGVRTISTKFSLYPAQTYSIKLTIADMASTLPWKEERMPFLPASAIIFYSTTISLVSGDLQGI